MTLRRPALALLAALVLLAGPAVAQPEAQLRANRTGGVAPLAVFFDARATTHPDAALLPFHELVYTFDFGDPAAGNWGEHTGDAYLGRFSKNRYRGGPMAGHVYETPGTYTAQVTAEDPGGGTSTRSVTITVEDPEVVFAGAATLCVANPGEPFDGCPAGARTLSTASFSKAAAQAEPGTRVLLRRGDVFTGSGSTALSGPGLLGAFGAGRNPVISNSARAVAVEIGSDWRVVDVSSVAPADSGTHHFSCGGNNTTLEHLLLLRVSARGGHMGFGCGSPTVVTQGLAVVDSVFENQRDTEHQPYGVYHLAFEDQMFMGNRVGGSGGHNLRFPWARNGFVFTFNSFHRPPQVANFRLHGKQGVATRYAIVGYNSFGRSTRGLNINQVTGSEPDELFDVIVEGNFSAQGGKMFNLGVRRGTARHNVMRRVGLGDPMFRIWQRGSTSGSQFDVGDIWIHDNTYVVEIDHPGQTANLVLVKEQDGGAFRGSGSIRDNLVYAPGAVVKPFPPELVTAGNLVIDDADANPFAVSMPGTAIDDYRVASGVGAREPFGGSGPEGPPQGDDDPTPAPVAAPVLLQ